MYGVNASGSENARKTLIAYEGKRLGGAAGASLEDILHTDTSPNFFRPKTARSRRRRRSWSVLTNCTTFICIMPSRWGFPPEKVLYLAKAAFKEKYSDDTLRKWLKNFTAVSSRSSSSVRACPTVRK